MVQDCQRDGPPFFECTNDPPNWVYAHDIRPSKFAISADENGAADRPDTGQAFLDQVLEDIDNDLVPHYEDTCNLIPNAGTELCDTDGDGIGNMCDGDFNQSGISDATDFDIFTADFGTGIDSGVGTDLNCSGTVDATDFNLFLPMFQGLNVPSSGLWCADETSTSGDCTP
jgi:hypothetical protein